MKKTLFLSILVLALCCSGGFALADSSISAEQKTTEFLQRIKVQRDSIHSELNLSNAQIQRKNEIDAVLYKEIQPLLYQISLEIKKIDELAKSGDCSKKSIDAVKKEFRVSEKELSKTAHIHEKEFKDTLTLKQKLRYKLLKRQARAKLKQEMKEQASQQMHANQ